MGRNDLQFELLQKRLEHAGQQVIETFRPAFPFIIQAAVSMGAYATGLGVAQGIGLACRVSCATPVAANIGGILGVGFASAFAGQASIKCQIAQTHGIERAFLHPGVLFRDTRRDDLITDAVLGIAAFRLMGGIFHNVMPSDLTKVGAVAKNHLPAGGREYATSDAKMKLGKMYRQSGCHHCGKRSGRVIGDHMPPNKHAIQAEEAFRKSPFRFLMKYKTVKQAMASLGYQFGAPPQRFYPQCIKCSGKQSAAVRAGVSRLVWHRVLHRGGESSAWHYAGVLVGLRHEQEDRRKRNGKGAVGMAPLPRSWW